MKSKMVRTDYVNTHYRPQQKEQVGLWTLLGGSAALVGVLILVTMTLHLG